MVITLVRKKKKKSISGQVNSYRMKNHKYTDINWSCVTALRTLKKVKNTAKKETTSTKGEKSAEDKGQTKTKP